VIGSHPARVSVVIPVFNGLRFLPQAVSSVENQTYAPIQLVLVDGGSTDGSREWIDSYAAGHVVDVEALPHGTPAAVTWTRACELATGEFVTLLCQDDLLYPTGIEQQVEVLQKFPEASMVAARRDLVDASGRILKHNYGAPGIEPGVHSGAELLRIAHKRAVNIFGEPLAVMFRRAELERHLPWVDTHPFMLDLDMYARVLAHSYGCISHDTVGAFRISSSSWSTSLAQEQNRQFALWQESIERQLSGIDTTSRLVAALNRHRQSALRRLAYLWLGLTGRL
jgi:glycosyltransferase involved in cell wall biosynthesis